GRYVTVSELQYDIHDFQSSPNPEAGRYTLSTRKRSPILSFNPRPTRRLGATAGCELYNDLDGLSILAQPGGWALPNLFSTLLTTDKLSILAQPGGWALQQARRAVWGEIQ